MNKTGVVIAGILALAGFFAGSSALFTINETEHALVLQFGDPRRAVSEPGLHIKLPFVQNVVYVDKRVLNLDTPREEIISADQKRLVVDAFARYKITDPLQFYRSVRDMRLVDTRLQPLFSSSMRNILGAESLETLVRDDRSALMQRIEEDFNQASAGFGVEVVDVRIKRADLPPENSQAIFRRMQTEREQEAAEIRAQGEETAQRIQSRADRDVTVLLAEAKRDSERIRGEGDALRNRIFAEAYGKDPEFFSFYRSMLAYQEGLQSDSTTLVLSPDSEFFQYFGNAGKP